MNTTINTAPIAVAFNPVTAEMIAKRLGLSPVTIRNCLGKNLGKCSQKTVDLVRKTAEEMGYDPKKARAKGIQNATNARMEKLAKTADERRAKKEADYLLTHNFPSKAAETRRMLYLQSQGMSNAEIGKAVGRCYLTVLRRIGKQPDDVTKANVRYGNKLRAQKNAHRRLVAADHTVNTYNGMVTELAEVKAKVVLIEGQVKAMLPKVKEAAKISQVKMIEDVSDAPATTLQ